MIPRNLIATMKNIHQYLFLTMSNDPSENDSPFSYDSREASQIVKNKSNHSIQEYVQSWTLKVNY